MKTLIATVAAGFALALPAAARAPTDRVSQASSGQYPEAGDMVLFPLDDISIPWRDNLKLTLEAPTKYPENPVMKSDSDEGPEGNGPVLYGTVIKEGNRFRMWYIASPRPDPRLPGETARLAYFRPYVYAESRDGVQWVRPNLGLVDFRGSKNNNLVLIEPSSEPYTRPYDFVAVLRDPLDPDPSRLYKMAYISHDFARSEGVTGTAVSPDGYRWRLARTTSFTQGHFENTSLTKFEGLYYVAGQNVPQFDAGVADGSPAGRVMKVFFSPDFSHWSEGRALGFYRSDYVPTLKHFGQEVHMGAGLWNRGNILLGFYGRWHGNTLRAKPRPAQPFLPAEALGLEGLTIDLGLVVSNDAIHYREPVRNFVEVHRGTDDEWDSRAVLQGNAFANTDTQTLIWYSHWNTDRPRVMPPIPGPLPAVMLRHPAGIGLLTMPRDRFGYFSKLLSVSQSRNPAFNTKRGASCLTKPIVLSRPSELSVNLGNVSSSAPLEIALVDDAERPLPGYSAKLTKDSLKLAVDWSGGQKTLPAAAPFRVKVIWPAEVDQARIYAIYIEHI